MCAPIGYTIFGFGVRRKRVLTAGRCAWLFSTMKKRLDKPCDTVISRVRAVKTLVHGRGQIGQGMVDFQVSCFGLVGLGVAIVILRVNDILVFVAFKLHDIAAFVEGYGLPALTAGQGAVTDVTRAVKALGDE